MTVQEEIKNTKNILQEISTKSMSDSKEHDAIHSWWAEAQIHVGSHLQQLQQYDGDILQYEAETVTKLEHITQQDLVLEQQEQDEGRNLSKLSTIEGQLHQQTSIANGFMAHARSNAQDYRDKATSLRNNLQSLSRELNEFRNSEPRQ